MNFVYFLNNLNSLFPRLFKEAKITNIICASSFLGESGFSICGYIQRKKRSRLFSKTIRQSILARQISQLNEIEANR